MHYQKQHAGYIRKFELSPNNCNERQLFSAHLTSSHQCEALGIAATEQVPLLNFCRSLLAAGFDPGKAVDVYRNDVLALRVPSVREGAKLTVEDSRAGVSRFRVVRPHSPWRSPACASKTRRPPLRSHSKG